MLNNKVYFGEYTLLYWIRLILSKDIVLPEFQRSFCWEPPEIKKLIGSLKNGYFVPPIVIGAFDDKTNYIIDGQQRLTSVLCSYYNVYPPKNSSAATETFMSENDDEPETIGDGSRITLSEFQSIETLRIGKRNTLEGNPSFKSLYGKGEDLPTDEFFESRRLPFCFLVPLSIRKLTPSPMNDGSNLANQRYFSSVFYSINSSGRPLDRMESRRALYFLQSEFKKLFEPDFAHDIRIVKPGTTVGHLDFLRTLALISDYCKCKDVRHVYNINVSEQEYYLSFIYSTIGDEASERFTPLKADTDLSKLKLYLKELEIYGDYGSIIDVDMLLFGLVAGVVFNRKSLDIENKFKLKNEIKAQIDDFKQDKRHVKTPAGKKFLRERLKKSLEIYNKYWI